MSHNVTLDGVKITDLDLLNSAIKNLKIPEVSLDKTAKQFRTYDGQPTNCDAKINLPGKHDIGLRKGKDGYDIVFDPYQMTDTLRHPALEDDYSANAKISKLLQEYGLVQAEYEAAKRGMTSQRIKGENGHVALEIAA